MSKKESVLSKLSSITKWAHETDQNVLVVSLSHCIDIINEHLVDKATCGEPAQAPPVAGSNKGNHLRKYAIVLLLAIIAAQAVINAKRLDSMAADLDGLYQLNGLAGNTAYATMDAEVRILHYVKPHMSDRPPVFGCPECYEYIKRHKDAAKLREKGEDESTLKELL